MRILFMPAPAVGHAVPMVPLAWACRTAGHDVLFVTAGDGLRVADAGLAVLDALPGRSTQDMYEQFVRDWPDLFVPATGDPIAALDERKPRIVATWDPFVDEHVAAAERARPDLVVYDPVLGVGALVAATLGIPAVGFGFMISRYAPELLRELPAAGSFRRHGLEVPEDIPTLDLAPPSLVQPPASPWRMRYVPYNGGAVLPDWVLDPPPRRRVAVSFGSLEQAHGSGSLARLARAAADVDAEFVIATGEPGRVPPDELPGNVRVLGWTPLNALLPTCAAAIHHGGSGSALTCCVHGIPQLALPERLTDAASEAEHLRLRGAALVVEDDELDAALLDELLTSTALRRVAGELRDEIAALPSPDEVVRKLEALASPARELAGAGA